MKTPRVLGIIPTYGQLAAARQAAETFLAATPGGAVLLADDGTPDEEWRAQDWKRWPRKHLHICRFKHDANLTRSWNFGLAEAHRLGAEFAVCGNSDLIFPDGWWRAVEEALRRDPRLLAGPLTNAPGPCRHQRAREYLPDFEPTDDPAVLAAACRRLYDRHGSFVKPGAVNGCCMAALTSTWWRAEFEPGAVFNPAKKMTGNEDDLQRRWKRLGLTYGAVLGSLVGHYRGLSRGLKPWHKDGSFRPRA